MRKFMILLDNLKTKLLKCLNNCTRENGKDNGGEGFHHPLVILSRGKDDFFLIIGRGHQYINMILYGSQSAFFFKQLESIDNPLA